MGKTTGTFLTVEEFRNLRKGDIYFTVDGNLLRTFDHFHKRKPNAAVATDKMVSYLNNMRWPTPEERGIKPAASALAAARQTCPAPVAANVSHNTITRKENKMNHSTLATTACHALAVVKDDATDAAWRTGARQAVRTVKQPLVTFLTTNGLPGAVGAVVGALLNTDHGEGALALVLGSVLPVVPQFGSDRRFVRLAKEMRVLGMDTFLNNAVEMVLNPLRDQLADIIKSLPGSEV